MGCRTSFVAALVIGMDGSRQLDKNPKLKTSEYRNMAINFPANPYVKYEEYDIWGKAFFTFEKLKFWNLFMS